MTPHELTCRELVEIITDYIEGAMAPADSARFEEHLAVCEGCSNYLDQMRRTIRVTGALASESMSDDARTTLLVAFRDWKAR